MYIHVGKNDECYSSFSWGTSNDHFSPSLSDLYWEQHYPQIPMPMYYLEETDRLLPEYPLPERIERLIEEGKYNNVEDRVTKVCGGEGGGEGGEDEKGGRGRWGKEGEGR